MNGRPCTPETIGVMLSPENMTRLENVVTKLQEFNPHASLDDCIDTVFLMGLTVAELTTVPVCAEVFFSLNKLLAKESA